MMAGTPSSSGVNSTLLQTSSFGFGFSKPEQMNFMAKQQHRQIRRPNSRNQQQLEEMTEVICINRH
jgi:hypothetical protein